MSGLEQRQQCGYLWVYGSVKCQRPSCFSRWMIRSLVSRAVTSRPSISGQVVPAKRAVRSDRPHQSQAVLDAGLEVVRAEGRRQMHQSGAVVRRHEVGGDDDPG